MDMPTPRFDWTFNLGHLLTIGTLLVAGFAVYLSVETRITQIDNRTADYFTTRDLSRDNAAQLRALNSAVDNNRTSNRVILEQMSKIREDVAAIRATLEADGMLRSQP